MATRKESLTRDESNILVAIAKLETKVDTLTTDIKEINVGLTARVLNLEANSVSKFQHDQLVARVTSLEDSRIAYRASMKVWLILGAVASSGVAIVATALINSFIHI